MRDRSLFWRSARAVAFCALIAGVSGGCALINSNLPTEEAPARIASPAEGYVLEPGNQIRLTVFSQENLSGSFVIDASGKIALPLVGNVPASGVTAPTLAGRVADALRQNAYMQDPKVSVEVQTFRPFYVLGEVRNPGEFPYMTGMTVLSAVARAGGYDYRAREGEVELVRQVGDVQKPFLATERTPILPGDIIKVHERRF